MIVDGNFISAQDGVATYARDQIVSINLGGASATVDPNWNTNAFTNACYSWAYDSYVRGIGWSPDGSYFVVAATGGYYNSSFQDCDAASRFNASSTGLTVAPAWIDFTGTDSIYSVAVTSSAVYIGGHYRWLNNPYGQDNSKNGAVPRPGLAALDPANGVPLSWNPGRNPRGHGAEVVYATQAGIWVGSATPTTSATTSTSTRSWTSSLSRAARRSTGNNGGDARTVFVAGARRRQHAYGQHFRPDHGHRLGGRHASRAPAAASLGVRSRAPSCSTAGSGTPRAGSSSTAPGTAPTPSARPQLVDPYDDPYWDNVPDRLRPDLPGHGDQLLRRAAQGDRHVLRQPVDLLHAVRQRQASTAGPSLLTRGPPRSRAR